MRRSLVHDRSIELSTCAVANQTSFSLGQSGAARFVDRATISHHMRLGRGGVMAGEAG